MGAQRGWNEANLDQFSEDKVTRVSLALRNEWVLSFDLTAFNVNVVVSYVDWRIPS